MLNHVAVYVLQRNREMFTLDDRVDDDDDDGHNDDGDDDDELFRLPLDTDADNEFECDCPICLMHQQHISGINRYL